MSSGFAVGARKLQAGHTSGSPGSAAFLPDARALFSIDPCDGVRWLRFRGADSPERLLSLAIMCQALADLRKAPRGRTSGKDRHLYRDTVAWFRDDDAAHPFSFRVLCERFDWSAEAVRSRVLGAEEPPERPHGLRLVRRR